ncbi:DUF47 domain-containing protein [Maridesulfovibrio bastinii]|uniref:DUF47 domain-containing protein n=1 Tax=Maridesulfovibrio bastinii TaxID=47157 RepID=UPI000404D322|nr:DUF47 family protein [Maridesulfovibrio bastinii]
MSFHIPFLGLLSTNDPMEGLVKHYDKIAECIQIINDSVECYVTNGNTCKEFKELTEQIDTVEAQADKIKRSIRNHLPRSLFMTVDKTLFLNYTSSQDNVLDYAQDALHWLAMRRVEIPVEFQKDIIGLVSEINEVATSLGPALKTTISLINGKSIDREGTKNAFRKVRGQREKVKDLERSLSHKIFTSKMNFKDIYQLIHFVDCIDEMAHAAESCADILRSMIAR